MKTVLKLIAILAILVVVAAAGTYLWASSATSRTFAAVHETHRVDFPIPFPATPGELAAAGVTEDADGAIARANALERGRHLVTARYDCTECHGENFGGGVMVDAFPIGSLLGPNLTSGRGSIVADYTAADWDRAVRHGVLSTGHASIMPAQDFVRMSDQELSDIITYIQAQPPVDNEVPRPRFGPLGKILVATGQFQPAVNAIADHHAAHATFPPAAEVSHEFGEHIAATCVGCHGPTFSGGPIVGGDPSWPPAANLTPHETGLAGWTYDDFVTAVRHARRPDGTALRPPMTFVQPTTQAMTDVELEALWQYLQSLPPTPVAAR
jgi:cytochrome c553